MKKLFVLIFAAAALVASCQKSDRWDQAGEQEAVTFTVNLPGSIDTKLISDGTKAIRLFYAAYAGTEDKKIIGHLCNTVDGVEVKNMTAVVTLQLVKNIEYDIVFWAQSEDGSKYYSFDWDKAQMTVDYDGNANDENRDAFYQVLRDYKVEQAPTVVKLYRPFAQINFGASDYSYVTDYYDEDSVDAGMMSSFKAKVPNTLNLLEETLGATVAEVKFVKNAIPGDPKELTVKDKDYRYVAMNYVLAPKNEPMVLEEAVTATFYYKHDQEAEDDTATEWPVTVENVPIRRNYRTNILGNFFTEEGTLTIKVCPCFEDDYVGPPFEGSDDVTNIND